MQHSIVIDDKASTNNSGVNKTIFIALAVVVIMFVMTMMGACSRSEAYEKGRTFGIGAAHGAAESGNQLMTGGTKAKYTSAGQQLAEASGYKQDSKEANDFCDGFDYGWQEWANHVSR